MSEIFKVGDVCIGQNHIFCVDLNGMECEVIGPLKPRTGFEPDGSLKERIQYLVLWANGKVGNAAPCYLRKKRPPSREIDTVVAWADCAWKPQGVTA